MTSTLQGITDMGEIQSERLNKDSNISPIPLPTAGSAETSAYDTEGSTIIISVSGILTSAAGDLATIQSDLKSKIDQFESLISGNQTTVRTYTSPVLGVYLVKVMRFTAEYIAGSVPSVAYTIELLQAKAD